MRRPRQEILAVEAAIVMVVARLPAPLLDATVAETDSNEELSMFVDPSADNAIDCSASETGTNLVAVRVLLVFDLMEQVILTEDILPVATTVSVRWALEPLAQFARETGSMQVHE
jgi:hypothetical protein